MSKHIPLYLTTEQRAELETLIKSGNAPARVQTRARILLLADRNQDTWRTDAQIADTLLYTAGTVLAIRHRFLQEGLQVALVEKPRPGAVPKITGDIEAQITVLACSDPPEGHCRWTVRLLIARVIELGLVDKIDPSTLWTRLKKHAEALAGENVVHRHRHADACGPEGSRAGRVPASACPQAPGRLCR